MRYETYFDAFASSQSHLFSNPQLLARRLSCEGIVAFASGMKEAADEVLTKLASTGTFDPCHLPFVPRGTFSRGLNPAACAPQLLDFLLMFDKLMVDGRDVSSGIPAFLDRNNEVKAFVGATWEDRLPLDNEVRRWITAFLGDVPTVLTGCKHGPGATAERLISWDKWLAVLDISRRQTCMRLTEVPKDFRKKRIIGIEPTWSQFLQQGIARTLRHRAERWSGCGPSGPLRYLTNPAGHVAHACRPGNTTIDLSDASDRIPLSLVEYLVGEEWYKLFALTSSRYARVGSGPQAQYHPLHMMATMGNGFCFELETLVFHLVTAIAIFNSQGAAKWRSFNACMGMVSVFGDDIVAPLDSLPCVEQVFNLCGFRLSEKKTCRTPEFRETCGFWITPTACLPRFTPSLCGNRTELVFKTQVERYDLAARALDLGYAELGGLLTESAGTVPHRWNKKLQRSELLLSCLIPVERRANVLDDIRYLAYWKTGISDAVMELCTFRAGKRWMPMASYPFHAVKDLPTLRGFRGRFTIDPSAQGEL